MKTNNNELTQNHDVEKGFKFVLQLLINNWQSLLLLLIGVYLPLQIFEIMAVKVLLESGSFLWDVPILLTIHQTAQPQLDILAVILATIGSPKVLVPILIVISLVLILWKKWRLSAYLLTTGIGSAIINVTAKQFIHRIRPHLWESTYHHLGFAFPSGHAMASMTFVTILLVLTWQTKWRLVTVVFGSLFIFGIAWSRLYLGVHFPSDILAGWMVSLAWCVGVYILMKPDVNQSNSLPTSNFN